MRNVTKHVVPSNLCPLDTAHNAQLKSTLTYKIVITLFK
uniref:Uncharacterized protein n=1 Tax=Arundo donax TaxID=35708 RepID=A0A0A9FRK8_ARUDO